MQNIGPYLVGAAFWIFIGAAAVAGIVTDYKRRRAGVDVLRMAVEKGLQLDPALIEKLTSSGHQGREVEPVYVKLGGIICVASGVGICMLAFFVSQVRPIAFFPILGGGVVAICVGIGLIIGAKVLAEARERGRPRNAAP